MKVLRALSALAVALLALPPAGASSFTVMTYNVRGDNTFRHEPGDPASVADAVVDLDADVAGLQEIDHDEAAQVARDLAWDNGCTGEHCLWTQHSPSGEGLALLSRYRLTEAKVRELPPRGRSRTGDDHVRFLLRAVIIALGRRVFVYVTHLTPMGDPYTRQQAANAARDIADDRSAEERAGRTFRHVVLGDLNASTWEHPGALDEFGRGAGDAWEAVHARSTGETCRYTPDRPPVMPRDARPVAAATACGLTASVRQAGTMRRTVPIGRIDHVFIGRTAGLTVTSARVPWMDEQVPHRDGGAPRDRPYWGQSDHLPLAVTLADGAT